MNVHAYFQIIFYIMMLPVSFKVLTSMRLEEYFKRGTQRQVIVAFYFIASIALSQLFIDYFVRVISLAFQIFE